MHLCQYVKYFLDDVLCQVHLDSNVGDFVGKSPEFSGLWWCSRGKVGTVGDRSRTGDIDQLNAQAASLVTRRQ